MVEEDVLQRYAEDPSQLDDWRGARTVAGCPARDTLWAKLTAGYTRFRLGPLMKGCTTALWLGSATSPPL